MVLTNPLLIVLVAATGGVLVVGSGSPRARSVVAMQVQSDCPDAAAFAGSNVREVRMPQVVPGAALDSVRSALARWDSAVRETSARKQVVEALDRPVLMVQRPMQAMAVQTPLPEAAATCFAAHRSERGVDYRIAFQFVVHPTDSNGTALELRWIGQHKGRGERQWQADASWSQRAVLALVQYLGAGR